MRNPNLSATPAARTGTRALVILIQALLLGLTTLELAALLAPAWKQPLSDWAAALLAVFIPPAFIRARPTTKVMFSLLALAVAAAAWRIGDAQPIWDGLRNVVLLGAFLCVLQLLRTVAHAGSAIRDVRTRLSRLDERQAESSFAVGAFGLGSFLSFGAHAVLAPLLRTDADDRQRTSAALASIRGISFAAFWSPLFVGVAFVTHQIADVPALSVILLGLGCGLAALLCDLGVSGMRLSGLARIPYSLAPLLPISLAIAAVFAAIAFATGISAMGAVVAGVPLVAAAMLIKAGRRQAPAILKASLNGIVYGADELLLVAAANVLAAMLTGLPGFLPLVAPILSGLPTFLLLLTAIGLMLLAGAIGLHPAISAAVLLGAFDTIPDAVNRLALAEALIIGWSLAVTISPVGVTVMVAGQMFQVPYARLIVSRNLVSAAVVSVVSAGLLSLLDLLVRAVS